MRDITNQRFGRLIAESYHHSTNHRRFWQCKCDCGNVVIIRQSQLTCGKTKSCGCYGDEVRMHNLELSNHKRTERKTLREVAKGTANQKKKVNLLKREHPRLYRIWCSMKSRCYYQKNKCFHCYGGRGITICDDWRSSFDAFANWALANGYSDELSIDRIDVNGHYCPENCRWATNEEQQRNKRKSPSRKT